MSAPLHRHHVDGRLGPGLAYFDDRLVTVLPAAEHARLHLVLGDLDAQFPCEGEPVLLHRVRRHAITAGWAADHGRTLTFDARAARSMQHLWLDVLAALGDAS